MQFFLLVLEHTIFLFKNSFDKDSFFCQRAHFFAFFAMSTSHTADSSLSRPATQKMPRTNISVGRRLMILRDLETRQSNGESLKSVARSHGVQPSQIRRWKANKDKLSRAKNSKKTVASGRKPSFLHLEDELMGWAFALRDEGKPVKYSHIQLEACKMDDSFKDKTIQQQYHIIRRLCVRNCFVVRQATHKAQEHPQKSVDEAIEWLQNVRPIVAAVPVAHRAYILNMDQTPLNFSLEDGKTLHLKGERTVTVRSTGGSKARTTVSLTVAMDGTKLKPFVIFKGTANGRIVRNEFPQNPYRNDMVMVCQPNAYQDDQNMMTYVNTILVPHLQQKAQGAPVVLFLDHFKVHYSNAMKQKMTELGVNLQIIPGGCTWLVQPVDVGIGKPFKDRCRRRWWNWMMEEEEVSRATRVQQCKWIKESWDEMPATVVRNAWRKSDLSFLTNN